jgi:hypothetical protein
VKILSPVSEDAVIAEFLLAEIDSPRFRDGIIAALGSHAESVITNPDVDREDENQIRREILGLTRGYGCNQDLFERFPDDVQWYRVVMSKPELSRVEYIHYSYWNELSNGTRLPSRASKMIRDDTEIFGVSNQGFLDIFNAIRNGKTFPRLLLVSCNEHARVVVLEGHARITAYFIDDDWVPDELEVLIGYSEKFIEWDLYG